MRAEGRMCWQGWFGRAGFIIENIIVFGKGGISVKESRGKPINGALKQTIPG